MSNPVQSCTVCGDTEEVVPGGREFPPSVALKRLQRRCRAKGHMTANVYRAGVR